MSRILSNSGALMALAMMREFPDLLNVHAPLALQRAVHPEVRLYPRGKVKQRCKRKTKDRSKVKAARKQRRSQK